MELPVITFIQTRLQEANPLFESRQGTAHYDLFIQPQELMLQPLNDYMSQRMVGQSVRLMLQDPTPDTPTTFASTDVDNLASNLFVTRDQGAISTGIARVYYTAPTDLEFPALTAQFTAGSLNFYNSTDFVISSDQMALQSDGSLFYADIPVQAEQAGDDYDLPIGSITAILNDPNAVKVSNLSATVGGLPAQTNTQLLNQIPNSIAVRDLETGKGINAILTQDFPFLQQIVSIGMGDPEMQRDIQYNIHIGAKADVYLQTPSLTTGTFTATGLIIDTTRNVPRNYYEELARSLTDPDFPADTGTPSIVPNTVVIKENKVETAASIQSVQISSVSGIDLSATPWLNLQLDSGSAIQFKIAGVNPAQTQLFEIINAINAAFGVVVAAQGAGNSVRITSLTIGSGSQIVFDATVNPILTSQNAAFVLFGVSLGSLPFPVLGVVAQQYVEGVDYVVDYANGDIYQTPFTNSFPTYQRAPTPPHNNRETITSGQTMINEATTGQVPGGNNQFNDPTSGAFLSLPLVQVRPGDEVTITASNVSLGFSLPATFIVSTVTSANALLLSGFNPTNGSTATVTYSVVSNQVVSVSYQYNPISIDIGPQVLITPTTRGIRPGREAYTITDVPFITILSIQQVDPTTLEPIGNPLIPSSGYGAGGYGRGGYGQGLSGDYTFFVNSPPERFSVYEDSVIIFNENSIGLSYTVTYLYNPELVAIHNLTRSDTERVTGADVLVKSFIPCFVDVTIGVRLNASSTSTPSLAQLGTLVGNLIQATIVGTGIDASSIESLLTGQGVASVQTPFTMTGTIDNPDGSTSIVQSEDVLQVPAVTLPSQTSNYTTPRIVDFWPRNVIVQQVT